MRLSKLVRTLAHISAMSGALLLCTAANGQELLPSVSFTAGSGSWSSDGNWTLDGSDPPQDGAPLESEIAVIGAGVASVDSDVGSVHSLSITRGNLNLGSGGAVTVENQAIVGSAGTLTLGGGSLSAGSLAVLGTIDLPADADLSFGTSFPVAATDTVLGTPRSITVGGRRATLPTGLNLGMVATADGASVVVESLPVLEVSRETGVASIRNLIGGPVDIAGYSIASPGNLLERSWDSLEDQGVAGWVEANPERNARFSELNLLGSSTLNVGDSIDLGEVYTGIGEPPANEDLSFEVLLADGRSLSAAVQFTGPPNDLFLAIDPETGEGTLNHVSPLIDPFDVTAISILSPSGSLNSPTEATLGDGWTPANPQDTAYAEVNLEGSRVFSQGDSVSLGAIFDTGGVPDLTFTFATTDGALRTGSVIFGDGASTPTGPICNPNTGGDLDGDGTVGFGDFLLVSNNFGQTVADHTSGDVDCSGDVGFSDFLIVSNAFGTTVGAEAASVPEPNSGLLLFLGFLGMLKFRKRAARVAVVAAAITVCCASSQDAHAQFDAQFIRVHPAGPNNGIGTLTEALGIVNGTVVDAILNENITGEVDGVLDFGGGVGTFDFEQQPYLNGGETEDMGNFAQLVSGTVEIPAGDYTIGCGSDDGCLVQFSNPEVTFIDRFNENNNNLGDSTIFFNAGRGHDWTFGTFSVPAGGVTTGILTGFSEGGGGDSFEVAIFNEHIFEEEAVDGAARAAIASLFFELGDGVFDWNVTGDPFVNVAGDFNADGLVDDADAEILVENFGVEGGFAQGDINLDGDINFQDASLFRPIFAAASAGGEASVVPEPGSVSLLLVGFAALLGFRRRKRA